MLNKKDKDKIYDRYLLFDRPSFFCGMAKIMDIGNSQKNIYYFSDLGPIIDYISIMNDYNILREDYNQAFLYSLKRK